MKLKKLLLAIPAILILLAASGFLMMNHTKKQIRELFRMNKQLQEQGYYMGDFEFKMLGMAYWLDKGHYVKALSRINNLHRQFQMKEDLVKVPNFISKEDEMEFYLNLQNPKTGAFMDDSYPYCMYNEVTENVVNHLEALTKETRQPFHLKYPLTYLDEINTPEKLKAFLDDVSYVGWLASKLPQTTFVSARSILNYSNGEGVLGDNHFYDFSAEWKQALLQWFYENQDPQTGFWGPRSRTSGKLLKKDLTNTASIIKTFVDKNGNDIYESFPLRYKNEMFKTALEVMSESQPSDDDLMEWHEWALKMGKGTFMMTRYLWKESSREDRTEAKKIIENFVRIIFEKYYIPGEGAFSYYPNGNHATLDGAGNFSIFRNIGAFSAERQSQLWGGPDETVKNLGIHEISGLKESDFELIAKSKDINSLRIYRSGPYYDSLRSGVSAIIYPKKTSVPDIIDLTLKMNRWIRKTSLSMGNWTSKESVVQDMEPLKTEEVPIYENSLPFETIEQMFQTNGKLIIIGFDILQVPRYMIAFELKK